MPFDSGTITMTRLERLERLRELLDQATDLEQKSFCSCLLHRASEDQMFEAAGLSVVRPMTDATVLARRIAPTKIDSLEDVHNAIIFFGFSPLNWRQSLVIFVIFGGSTVKQKRESLDQAIASERTMMTSP